MKHYVGLCLNLVAIKLIRLSAYISPQAGAEYLQDVLKATLETLNDGQLAYFGIRRL